MFLLPEIPEVFRNNQLEYQQGLSGRGGGKSLKYGHREEVQEGK